METWVDLLQSKSSLKKSSKRKTRATKSLKHSPVKQEVLLLDYSPGNNAPLRDGGELNDVELLQQKLSQQQIIIAEVTHEREHLLKQLELLRHQQKIVDNSTWLDVKSHDLTESSLTELQLQGLRDALDQVTMEKSSILTQLTIQRDEMTSLTNQLAEQQQRMVTMTSARDHMGTELHSCQQSLEECLAESEQLRNELRHKEEELEKQMDHSMELSVNVDKLRQQIATLSNPMDGDSADSDSLQSRLVELSACNVEVEKQLLSCQQNAMLLEQQVTSLQQANANLKVRNSTLEDSLIKAQLEIDSSNTKLATIDSSYQSDVLKLQQKLAKSEEHVNELSEERDRLSSTVRQQAAQCSTMETEHSLLQAKYDQMVGEKRLLEEELHMAKCSKVADHSELLAQCEALRGELLQQTNSGVAVVTGLQQQLNECKQVYDKLTVDYDNCQRERDDVTSKLCSVSVANEQLTLTNQKLLLQISDAEAELSKVKSDWMESCKNLKSSEHKIKTLTNNCAELDKQLVTMETSTIVQLNEQIQKLTDQLHQSSCYSDALEADKQALESKLSELENIVGSKRSECIELQEHLNEMTIKCDQLLTDLQATRAAHMIQQQEISDLKIQLTEMEQQMSIKLELTDEMNSLLVQRADRIEELENMLTLNETALCNDELHKVKQLHDKAIQADVSHTSPSPTTGGSHHDILSNHSQSTDSDQSDCASSSHSVSGCSSPVHATNDVPDYSEQLMAAELQYNELQQELTSQREKFDNEISLLSQQFKEDIVSLETSKQKEVLMLKDQINSLQQVLINQQTGLAGLVTDQMSNMASLRIEQSQVEEKSQLVKLVSNSQLELVQVTEDKIAQLITEVELLRTRKAIMKECADQMDRVIVSEQEKVLQVKVNKLQNKVNGLRSQLKKRNNHCNYLRLRLGYVLAEVRLYKRLKSDLDGQISILQSGFEQSSQQHLMCINLLEQAQHMSGNVPLV